MALVVTLHMKTITPVAPRGGSTLLFETNSAK